MDWYFFHCSAILIAFSVWLTSFLIKVQPTPYMDEIFHIPQAQKYCNGSFLEWDPMITTLPGLYVASTGLLVPISYLFGVPALNFCNVMNLRLMNVLFSAGNLYVIYAITKLLNRNSQGLYCSLKASVLCLIPVLFFFNFFYYTDPGSLFFVLFAYYFHLRGWYSMASIFGVLSLQFRQTNIIWIFFMALCNVSKNLNKQYKIESKEKRTIIRLLTHSFPVFVVNTVISCLSYAIVGVMAIAFVIYNEGIVVGDKSAHQPCFYPAQLGYFSGFTLAFALVYLISPRQILSFLKSIWTNKIVTVLAIVSFVYLVDNYTHEHPYLLADNRHYTFYIWSKFFKRYDWFKFAVIPVYVFSLWSINNRLSHMHWLIRASLWICVSAATVPQRLLELRYFIVPYIIVRLHINGESYLQLFLEGLAYAAVNAFTFFIFIYRPIFWPNIHDAQRIMW